MKLLYTVLQWIKNSENNIKSPILKKLYYSWSDNFIQGKVKVYNDQLVNYSSVVELGTKFLVVRRLAWIGLKHT